MGLLFSWKKQAVSLFNIVDKTVNNVDKYSGIKSIMLINI